MDLIVTGEYISLTIQTPLVILCCLWETTAKTNMNRRNILKHNLISVTHSSKHIVSEIYHRNDRHRMNPEIYYGSCRKLTNRSACCSLDTFTSYSRERPFWLLLFTYFRCYNKEFTSSSKESFVPLFVSVFTAYANKNRLSISRSFV